MRDRQEVNVTGSLEYRLRQMTPEARARDALEFAEQIRRRIATGARARSTSSTNLAFDPRSRRFAVGLLSARARRACALRGAGCGWRGGRPRRAGAVGVGGFSAGAGRDAISWTACMAAAYPAENASRRMSSTWSSSWLITVFAIALPRNCRQPSPRALPVFRRGRRLDADRGVKLQRRLTLGACLLTRDPVAF